ncbi:MAG: MauE/DoxX family redox-associated membrane protein [Planctomycetota bacterium]
MASGPGLIRSVVATPLRLAAAGVFGFAAFIKIGDPQAFGLSIQTFDFMPDHLVHVSAFAIPWIEMAVGVLLVLGAWSRAAALVYTAMLASFTLLVYVTLERGLSIECGCFGKLKLMCDGTISSCNLVQNGLLMGIGGLVMLLGPGRWSVDDLVRRARLGESRLRQTQLGETQLGEA